MAAVMQRGLAVAAVALVAGCLDSPPAVVDGADASPPGESDAAPIECTTIVRNQFTDTALWEPFEEPDASVVVENDLVHITVENTEAGAWGDITTLETGQIDGTELAAAVTIGGGASGTAGISWASEFDDYYYDLVVAGTKLQAIYAPSGDGSQTVVCDPCPNYDPVAHARFRLRAFAGNVHFQAAPAADDDWNEIASAPLRNDDYEVSAYGWADPGQTTDLTVSEMVWRRCDF